MPVSKELRQIFRYFQFSCSVMPPGPDAAGCGSWVSCPLHRGEGMLALGAPREAKLMAERGIGLTLPSLSGGLKLLKSHSLQLSDTRFSSPQRFRCR